MLGKSFKNKLMAQAAVLAAPLLLVGCSSVPDAVNPVEWYRSSVEYFSDEEAEMAEGADSTAETVSEEAARTLPKNVEPGFVAANSADRGYSEPVVRQGEVVNALSDGKSVDVAEQPPAPQAAPTQSVTTSEIAQNQPTRAAVQDRVVSPATSTQPVRDTRSVSEVYADSLAQTRPLDMNAQMGNGYDMMDNQFGTVVISGNGVMQQPVGNTYQPTQFAALNNVMTTDVRDTYAQAMSIEPAVVLNGQALSLNQFNPGMFTGSFQVATIQFGKGSANLTGEDVRILKEVLNIHRQQGGVIRVVGHASSRTRNMTQEQHVAVNEKVSLNRADMVARKLLQLGVTGDRLYVGGVSDSQPLYREVMPSGEAGNRRTEIFVDY